MYGRSGFVQYQFVLPKASGISGLRTALEKISNAGLGSFLAVLKQFGVANQNYLSFPEEGYTLALDFKMSNKVIELIKELDSIVLAYGGRVYLAKDALLNEVSFKQMYPNWELFQQTRLRYSALEHFSSDQSRRLGLQ
jgi:FAD/FMN-containing dehydrogenase